MIFGALAGAGMSLLGGAMSKPSSSKFRFRPQDFSGGALGSATFDKNNGLGVQETGADAGARNFFEGQFNQAAGDPMGLQQFGMGATGAAQGMFNPAFQASMAAGFDPSQQALGQFNQGNMAMQNMFGGLGAQGLGAAFGAQGAMDPMQQMAMQQAQGLFGQTDFNQMAQDRTQQLTDLARPQEETAVNQKFQNLFGSGRLGTSGGAASLGELQQAQNMAATQRGLAGMDFANQQRMQNLGAASGLLGQAGQFAGQGQNFAGNLGQFGMNAFGQIPGLQQGAFGNQFGLNQAQVGRADDRLSRVQDTLGFGTQVFEQPTAMAARARQGLDPINAKLFGLGDMSIRASNAASGSQQSGGSNPFGSALGGLGAGLFNQQINKDG